MARLPHVRAKAGPGLAALALASLFWLGACDQIASTWSRLTGAKQEAAAPSPLEQVPLEARALSGSVQPQDGVAALLAPAPVMVAAGQILAGGRVAEKLVEAASALKLDDAVVRQVRAAGLDGLAADIADRIRARAESDASTDAATTARAILESLGVQGAIQALPGGAIKIALAHVVATPPPAAATATTTATTQISQPPDQIEWTSADPCPRMVTAEQLGKDAALAMRCAMQRLDATHQFAFVEPNYIATIEFSALPRAQQRETPAQANARALATISNDPLLALQWNFRPRGQGPGFSPGGAGFAAFWHAHQIGSRQIRVAVIDTGLDFTHPEMHDSANIGRGVDLVSDPARAGDGDGVDGNPQDPGDVCGDVAENTFHGTHVAGIIGAGATNNHVGIAGGAWEATVIPVRALGRCGGELADIVSAISWAAGVSSATDASGAVFANSAPADIINLSFSLQAPCPASMQAAIDSAVARGALIVTGAGNNANQAHLFAPANCNNVIVVGAGDARGDLAFYSNFGPEIALVAPGGDVFADADNDGRPDGILSTRATRSGCYDPLNQNSTDHCFYSFEQGASLAAPHVSAALALLAVQTGLRGAKLEQALFDRAVSAFPAGFGRIECTRVRNATPVAGSATLCERPSGRGYLDMARAAASIPQAAPSH
ncbi:MAG: S8 family serine peptidase [Alphaproteobacteria bacterium]